MSDTVTHNKQKEIIDFLKRYIKSSLHHVTWDIEGEEVRILHIYMCINDIIFILSCSY